MYQDIKKISLELPIHKKYTKSISISFDYELFQLIIISDHEDFITKSHILYV